MQQTDIDVYGIGNALVDKEFLVNDEFFTEVGVEKGFMTLIDEEEQARILGELQRRFGLRKRAGGGSAANTLYALSQFGGRAFYTCKVANDEAGDFYVSELGNHNIETNLSQERETGVTGRCLVMVSPDAERTMLTNLGISQQVSCAELRPEAIRRARYAYIEGYLVTSDSARTAALSLKREAREHGVKIAFTFSDPSIVNYFRPGIDEVLGEDGVDLLFCNEKEALSWSGCDTLEAACKALQQVSQQYVITRGAHGALLFDGEKFHEVPGHPARAVDSNGAGDMFAGAFLYAVTQGQSMVTAAALANQAAAAVVSHIGPRLTPEQHQKILAEFQHQQPA